MQVCFERMWVRSSFHAFNAFNEQSLTEARPGGVYNDSLSMCTQLNKGILIWFGISLISIGLKKKFLKFENSFQFLIII